MIERIVGFISCLLCAIPFFIIAAFDKNSLTPITFWSGDKSLMTKVKDIPAYNREMARLYRTYGRAFLLAGAGCFLHLALGISLVLLESTVGIYIVYRKYKAILKRYL